MGEGAGYCVLLETNHPHVEGLWVTYNMNGTSSPKPSQGVAVKISGRSDRIGHQIMYGFLPRKASGSSAPVIVNLGKVATSVQLTFYSARGELLQRRTVDSLAPHHPYAVSTDDLISVGDESVYMIARSHQLLTGVSFVFNERGEASIGNLTAIDR